MVEHSYKSRLWKDTVAHTWPGITLASFVVNGVGLVAAVISSLTFGGPDFALGEIKSWGFFTFAWILVANLIYLLWNLLLAPSRLARQDSEVIANLKTKVDTLTQPAKQLASNHIAKLKLELASGISSLISPHWVVRV